MPTIAVKVDRVAYKLITSTPTYGLLFTRGGGARISLSATQPAPDTDAYFNVDQTNLKGLALPDMSAGGSVWALATTDATTKVIVARN